MSATKNRQVLRGALLQLAEEVEGYNTDYERHRAKIVEHIMAMLASDRGPHKRAAMRAFGRLDGIDVKRQVFVIQLLSHELDLDHAARMAEIQAGARRAEGQGHLLPQGRPS